MWMGEPFWYQCCAGKLSQTEKKKEEKATFAQVQCNITMQLFAQHALAPKLGVRDWIAAVSHLAIHSERAFERKYASYFVIFFSSCMQYVCYAELMILYSTKFNN